MHAQQAQLRDLRDQLARECARLEVVANDRQYPLTDELADGVAHHALLFRQQAIDTIEISKWRQRWGMLLRLAALL